MDRVFVLELPFDYSLYFTQNELIFCGAVALVVVALVLKSMFLKVQSGREGFVGQKVSALEDFVPKDGNYEGQVLFIGEIWNAQIKNSPLKRGESAKVISSEGLLLTLK